MAAAVAKTRLFQIPETDTDERAEILNREDSSIADLLAAMAAIVPPEKAADFLYYVMRLQNARSRAELFRSKSWLKSIDKAYVSGRQDVVRDLMRDPPPALDPGDVTIIH